MARETKSISVNPDDEQNVIEIWQLFGWELVSSQEIFNKDSHMETRDDGVYNVTSTTNYVKLVFSRETTMRNYAKLVALENEYCNVKDPSYYEPTGSGLLKFVGLAGLILGVISFSNNQLLFGFLGLALGVIFLIIRAVKKSKAKDQHREEVSKIRAIRSAILEKAVKVRNE